MAKLTPMMKQYKETKARYPDCLLLFRVGDFFELFFDDAKVAARELNITLTSRDGNKDEGIPMAGVPHHALETYLGRLIKKGYKVAICDQVEDPRHAKGLVRREITRIVTPGTILADNLLDAAANNWLAAVACADGQWGLAYCDISTGQFACTQLSSRERLESVLLALNPGEVVIEQHSSAKFDITAVVSSSQPVAGEKVETLLPADFPPWQAARAAVGLIVAYLEDKQYHAGKLTPLEWQQLDKFLYLDAVSQRNLELLAPLGGGKGPSLLGVLDKTRTAMGGRRMKNLITTPLTDAEAINQRLDCIQYFLDNYIIRKQTEGLLTGFYDLERIITRIEYGTANARDLLALGKSLRRVPQLKELLIDMPGSLTASLNHCGELCTLIEQAIHPDPPVGVRDGNLIRPGWSGKLDELREMAAGGSAWVRKYEQQLRDNTGIKSLKVGFNKVFGYYIEVTRANLDLVPAEFKRKQTLVNCERFETPELKGWEDKILTANERMLNLEYQLFCDIRNKVSRWARQIQTTARAIAMLDCYLSLAQVAEENNYCRPDIDNGTGLDIKNGRHPVVEVFGQEEFVPNDCRLDADTRQILIITGPNMAGKSTYMRQVALISLMAHIGSFVPADYAKIGVLDGIFTRIGANDDLASGRSTFMVEMTELAGILAKASNKSLILLDEIGRGTGTDDGISIARATMEYIHNHPQVAAKTLFATHYHQLIHLANQLPRVANCSVLVSERSGKVTFLHKIVEGGSDKSFGIYVARLAGLPQELVNRAQAYLESGEHPTAQAMAVAETAATYSRQPELDALLAELSELDPDDLSPRQAWLELSRLQARAKQIREVLADAD